MGNFDKRKNFNTLFIMDITSWLSLVIAILAFTTPAQSSEPRVVCYYTNWSVYRPGTARFNPQNINPYLCTHLIYAFGGFTKDNTLKPFDKYQDIEKGGYAKFTGLKTYNKNLKTMLAIGGWNEGSTRFSPMVAARDRRKEFVRNAIKFLRQNRFDGLDLDWEYPAFRDGGKPKDRENYSKLVRELREEFEREAEKTGKPRLLLTMAVPAGIEYIQKGFDVKTLNQYLDWMNLLTYDYHSAFEPAVNHHAPLFPLEEPNEYSVDNELNIDYTIKFYLENGADRDKLVLGIPTYGRSYTLFNPDAVEIGSPADGPGEQGDATREKGYLAYYEICEALKPSNKKRSVSSDEDSDEDSEEVEDEPWTIMHPNPNAMGPVAFKGNQWVGYDDVEIVRKKAEYVAENGLGGIMFWSIDNDDFRGNCHGKPYPLIEAAKEAYITKLGSTDNTIVRDKPKPVSSSSSRRRKNRPRTSSTTTTTTTTTTTPKPTTAAKSNKRKSSAFTSTTPAWNIITPEPPTTPDPGSDFKCTDEGFFQHPRDCKKYFWCLDSGPSNLGIVAHQFTCPSGLFFNKAADSCDFARNVLCKTPSATTKAPTTKAPKITTTTTTTTTTRKPIKLSTKSSIYFRTSTTTTTTPEPEESEEEYEDEVEDSSDIDAEDPKVIKELIDLIKKVGGVEQLEKHLRLGETPASTGGTVTTTQSSFNKKLYQKVLERTRGNKLSGNSLLEGTAQNSRRRPQNAGLEPTADKDKLLRKDRPQYVTINRARSSTTTTTEAALDSEEIEDEPEVAAQPLLRARAVEPEIKVATTTKPLQYVNIRRARPTLTTSDTADDTASRNALFERSEPLITVSEAPSSLDITNAKRENIPEYVTIRRRRPNIEETTTVQYHNNVQEVESQETVFEKEISSPSSQPQYTSILRTRSTTTAPLVEPNSPEPTTVLAVQISSLLNSPSSTEPESEAPEPETTLFQTTEITEPSTTTTTSTTTSTTTTSTAAPSSLPPRRTILRRRGSTTTTTSTPGPSSSTQSPQDRRNSFLRRTKATAPPDVAGDSDIESTDVVETTTNKYTRRGNSKFKLRKNPAQKDNSNSDSGKDEVENVKRPSFGGSAARSERPTRNFVRRKFGGANSTTIKAVSTTSAPSPAPTRRSFRVASRRRPLITTTTTTTTTPQPTTTTTTVPPTTTTQATTEALASEELLQDIGDTADTVEDPSLQQRSSANKSKIQRRPLVSLKEEDQNPSATNEEEKKRQSKKYSSTFKQNQLDEVLRQKAKSHEEVDVTTEGKTTVEDYSAETAVAIATHQLLLAPVPSIPDFDVVTKPTKKSTPIQSTQEYKSTHEFKYTSPEYTAEYIESKSPYTEEYSSTPTYRTSSNPNQYYVQTTTGTSYIDDLTATDFVSPKISTTSSFSPQSSPYPSTAFTSTVVRPSGSSTLSLSSELPAFSKVTYTPKTVAYYETDDYTSTDLRTLGMSTPTTLQSGSSKTSQTSLPTGFTSKSAPYSPGTFTSTVSRPSETSTLSVLREDSVSVIPRASPTSLTPKSSFRPSSLFTSTLASSTPSVLNPGLSGVSKSFGPSTARYVTSSEKFIRVPIEGYGYSTDGYGQSSSLSHEPSYFTREYLLESPVTKTYDDEYQYLSPITTPQTTTTRKIQKKTFYRKISTTQRPTTVPNEPSATTAKPRRVPSKKPFEKIQKPQPNRTYRPIENYDYYDDSDEKVAEKYVEGTKVVLHSKGTIECLDIGNFPHPSSCKKFISCARMESGAIIGWEYICPNGLSFDPVGGICNWSAGLGCDEKV